MSRKIEIIEMILRKDVIKRWVLLLFSLGLELSFFKETYSLLPMYALIHNFHYAHKLWLTKSDYMIGKYFHKCLYEYYPKPLLCFVDFLANLFRPNVFLQDVHLLCLLSSTCCFSVFKVYIFPQVLQICYFTSCIL